MNGDTRPVSGPNFAQPQPTPDPTKFVVDHPSDGPAFATIDQLNKEGKIVPLSFPSPRGIPEPMLTLQQVLNTTDAAMKSITASGQIVFHSGGDCGSTKGTASQNMVTDKLVSDFNETEDKEKPKFHMMLGDVVYNFGEAQYYYDQFYDPYRDYPAPILAVAGNHDGMISPLANATTLAAFERNFCAEGFAITPEAGGLSRTAQIQPGVFFTFEAPFLRILVLYSNVLEDPGVIADGGAYKGIGTAQLDFLSAALTRVKKEKFSGALVIATHHPSYTVAKHGWSKLMTQQIDSICDETGIWPHAFLAGHAHNYQRFTRTRANGNQIPYVVCGNSGHNVQKLSKNETLRAPQQIQASGNGVDQVVLENYDDTDYGYLRIVVTTSQLRIEYHPASDGPQSKTPDDSVTVDLESHSYDHYQAPDLGRQSAIADVKKRAKLQSVKGRK